MNVKTVPMSDLSKKCDDIYQSVMVVAQRTRQIIDERVIPIDENEEVDDSIQFVEREIVIEDIDKPMVVALEEYLDGKLKWREPVEDDPDSDEA